MAKLLQRLCDFDARFHILLSTRFTMEPGKALGPWSGKVSQGPVESAEAVLGAARLPSVPVKKGISILTSIVCREKKKRRVHEPIKRKIMKKFLSCSKRCTVAPNNI